MPFVWKPHWDHEKFNPEKCAASVADGGRSVGAHQCRNNHVVEHDGHKWCKQHGPQEETGVFVYAVYSSWGDGEPVLSKVPVVKETKKRIVVENGGQAFDYRKWLEPREVCRTPLAAWKAWVAKKSEQVESCRSQLGQKEVDLMQAEAGLEAVEAAGEVE